MRVGILGAAGYTGGELIRVLLGHPEAEIVFANSESNAGNLVSDVHEGLIGETDLRFSSEMPFDQVDVVFFCFGHGKSEAFLKEHSIPENVKIIDLAQDFRVKSGERRVENGEFATAQTSNAQTTEKAKSTLYTLHSTLRDSFIYGLPEINRDAIAKAQHVANPGCFATCIQLGLLPAAKMGLIRDDVAVNGITGSTGAGQKPGATTHFSWRNNNFSVYKLFTHQHLHEICQSLNEVRPQDAPTIISPISKEQQGVSIDFIPYRGDFARGIFVTEVIKTECPLEEVVAYYKDFYQDAAFTHYSDKALDLKQVVNTNKCIVHCEKIGNKLIVTSIIDNLLKGAVGQAVQNMNIMFGIDETAGLRLKASAF